MASRPAWPTVFETALELADGLVFAENADGGDRTSFSAKFACPVSGFTIDEIEPRLFSFNNPFGACPACDGLGTEMYFDPELVVPDDRLSPWRGGPGTLGQFDVAVLSADLKQSGCPFWVRSDHPLRPPARKPFAMSFCMGPATRLCPCATTTAGDRMKSRNRSKGSSPTWNGAGARPIPPGCVTNWPVSRRSPPAPRVTATGSSPKLWRSRLAASTSAKWPICPSRRRPTGSPISTPPSRRSRRKSPVASCARLTNAWFSSRTSVSNT